MKQTIVPAQITTIEDRIIGRISFRQLILLITPVFVATAMFIILPKFMSLSPYKLVIWLPIALGLMVSAVRLKNRLLIDWFILIARYIRRPSYYVYNKNSLSNRSLPPVPKTLTPKPPAKQKVYSNTAQPSLGQLAQLDRLVSQFQFKATKKGDLSVTFKQLK